MVLSGTGAYAGDTGKGTFVGRGVAVLGRLADGTCSEEPTSFIATVKATGTLKLA